MAKSKRLNLRGILPLVLGLLLLWSCFVLVMLNLQEDTQAGKSADETVHELMLLLPEDRLHPAQQPTSEEDILVVDNRVLPIQTINGRGHVGVLQIPALDLELPVQSPYNYDWLNYAPCLYAGDPYHNNTVICGHNYDSHFGRLKTLTEGDDLYFVTMDGEVFHYRMSVIEILGRYDHEEMLYSPGWDLTLFTCTLGGEYRVTVRFVRVQDLAV